MKRSVAIIGGGPAALMLACSLDENKFDVTLYEKNFALGRKFLVAGDGGFNLTHSEDLDPFIARYTPSSFLDKSIQAFTNHDLRDWLNKLGVETLVGSSKRVFPVKGIKPIDVLNAFLGKLKRKNVAVKTLYEWIGWNKEGALTFMHKKVATAIKPHIVVFALGGASWAKTGSDGSWTKFFEEQKINIIPFQASNCAYGVEWGASFLSQWEGKWLKNISLACGDVVKMGELVITKFGIEGGAVYALSPQIRKQLAEKNKALAFIDLKPTFTVPDIKIRLANKKNASVTQVLKDGLNLSGLQLALIKALLSKEEFMGADTLAENIKRLPLTITGSAPIDEAISTVGGISLEEVDETFQFKKLPHHYAIGEMLDWDAPTGGYLLQACFSMGHTLAQTLNKK